VAAQVTTVQCGDIVSDGSFTADGQLFQFLIELQAEDQLRVIGNGTIAFSLGLFSPQSEMILEPSFNQGFSPARNPSLSSQLLSVSGIYTIAVSNVTVFSDHRGSSGTGNGTYSLAIGCTLNDGTIINPGDTPPDRTPPVEQEVTIPLETVVSNAIHTLDCGVPIAGVFDDYRQVQGYRLNASSDVSNFNVYVETVGKYLATHIVVADLSGDQFARTSQPLFTASLETPNLPAAGAYSIYVGNDFFYPSSNGGIYVQGGYPGGIGRYIVYATCSMKNGDVVGPTPESLEPMLRDSNTTTGSTSAQSMSAFSGNGFPGVTPIDFSTVHLVPLIFDIPLTSSIALDGSGVSGFSFDASGGDVLSIDARRLQGNLGVGFVVFAQPNMPVFVAGPISTETFSTQVELPASGSYVIGLFRMNEVSADSIATAFQITVSLNP